jgi:hypothetical protein
VTVTGREALGEEVWRESGLGAPADIDALNQDEYVHPGDPTPAPSIRAIGFNEYRCPRQAEIRDY